MIEKLHGFIFGNPSNVECDCEKSQKEYQETGMCFTLENEKVINAWVECVWCSKELKEADIEDVKSVLEWWGDDEQTYYIFDALNEYLEGEEQ